MHIKLWGVRGSLPTPLSGQVIESKIRKALLLATPGDVASEESVESFIASLPFPVKSSYGGNTTCIEVRTGSGDLIILDCGSGAKGLGKKLVQEDFGNGKGVGNIFFTHSHWDHIQGIPFFIPFYIKGNRFNIYSPFKDMRERLEYQQQPSHFPVSLDYMQAQKNFFHLEPEEEFYINETRIITKSMPHPGGAFGYRIEEDGGVFVYTSDCEFNIESIDSIDTYGPFFRDADVAIFDTQYTFEESIDSKFEYGHSSASIAIDIAGRYNVKNLVLFHHEPDYDDFKLENVLSNAKAYQSMNVGSERFNPLAIDIAWEGMEFDLP